MDLFQNQPPGSGLLQGRACSGRLATLLQSRASAGDSSTRPPSQGSGLIPGLTLTLASRQGGARWAGSGWGNPTTGE